MKAVITQTNNSPLHTIDFSVELPIIIREGPTFSFGNRTVISRAQDLSWLAERMSEINVGRFHQEIINAAPVFHDYLSDLLLVDGLDFIHKSRRYRLDIVIGRCFHSEPVCRKVAEVVRQHFYPDHELSFESQLALNPPNPGDTHVHV